MVLGGATLDAIIPPSITAIVLATLANLSIADFLIAGVGPGFFLAFWAAPEMTVGHVLLAAGVSIYMLIAIQYEERDLTDFYGEDYRRYRAGVGMITPRFRRRTTG